MAATKPKTCPSAPHWGEREAYRLWWVSATDPTPGEAVTALSVLMARLHSGPEQAAQLPRLHPFRLARG